jgi:predicted nucleic acid-binding protein
VSSSRATAHSASARRQRARRAHRATHRTVLIREIAPAISEHSRPTIRDDNVTRIVVSIVSVEEVLEGAVDETAAVASLQRFTIQGLHLAQARRCALVQRRTSRRLGENDAWLVATAESIDADVVAADRAAFERLGARYLRFR